MKNCYFLYHYKRLQTKNSRKAEKCTLGSLYFYLYFYKLIEIALTGQATIHCSQTTQRDRKKLS